MPRPVNDRLVGHREGDRHAAHARSQPRVGEQREAVHGDRAEADERDVLVQAHQRAPEPGRRSSFVDIVRPSSTATVTSPSATSPRLGRRATAEYGVGSLRHRATLAPIVDGAAAARRAGRSPRHRRRRGRLGRRARRARASRPAVRAAAPSSRASRPPARSARARSTPIRPVHAGDRRRGRAGGGRSARPVLPDADVQARVATPPAPTRSCGSSRR